MKTSKKTRAKYRQYLKELDVVIRSSDVDVSPYNLAREMGVSNFLPTALKKLNFIVKRSTTAGVRYVWNLKGVNHEQIIDAVLEARARYAKERKEKTIDEINNTPLKDLTKQDLDAWRKRYQSQTPDVSDLPIRKEVYDVSTAGEINYNPDEIYNVPPKKDRALNRAILSKILSVGLDLLKNLITRKITKK
jgi:hypothetical protein